MVFNDDKAQEKKIKYNMESCAAVEREIDSVLSRFNAINEHSDRVLSDVINHLENLKNELSQGQELTQGQVTILQEALDKTMEMLQRLTTDHRELHGAVSKVGKSIDRNFTSDFMATSREDIFSNTINMEMLNRVIVQHLNRQGMEEVAEKLCEESGLVPEKEAPEPYAELHRILEALRSHDLEPALTWAITHSLGLEARGSSLEFKLHRLAFLQIVEKGVSSQVESINYARIYFQKFVKRFEREIQALMGMLLFLPQGIKSSPYRHMCAPEMWIEVADVFVRDACGLLGLNTDSPLTLAVNAGCTALPALLNIKQVMQSRQVLGIWSGRDELPIEIDLGSDNRYHSIFACPILRQQSTEENPPMKLVCGHVISRDALNKLCNGPKLKCPYCPMEQSPDEARLVFF